MKPSRVLAIILVMLAFPGVLWAQDVIQGCKKINNGQVRIVAAGQTCLPSEVPIQLTAGVSTGTQAPPAGAATGALRVVDQGNATIGLFLPALGAAARQVGDLWLALPVGPTGFPQTGFARFYQTATCSGDAYLTVDTTSFLRMGYVTSVETGLMFFYPGKPEVDGSVILGYGYFDGGTWTCVDLSAAPMTGLFGKMGSIDLSAFKAPFKIVQ